MNIHKAERQQAKIKMALQGPAGSGKTYSSLLLAKGLVGDFNKVCVIDTENGSSNLYAHLGTYNIIAISSPYTPEKYIQAIELAETEGMELIIIDSLSHGWENLLEFHGGMAGNSFSNWSKVTPRQNALFNKILNSPAHIIGTLRVKQDYVLADKNGKMVPEKIGLKAIQRDGVDYEFTIVFDIDIKHHATCSKDRTELFSHKAEFMITEETGRIILNWCQQGNKLEKVHQSISDAKSIPELMTIYQQNIEQYPELLNSISEKKNQISHFKFSENGNLG
ncbi:MAG: AAA family ATPase [Saprospiraceae bacterium]|nr:AAA family ATPase [Candidatus Vicinibacter affinis]